MSQTTTYIPADDLDLIRRHCELMMAANHLDEVSAEDLFQRNVRARRYIRRTIRKRDWTHRLNAFVQRLFVCSLAFFAWAVIVALLV